jgi:threonine synthase
LAGRGVIGANDRVVVISTAHGLKFTDFKINYHESRLQDVESRHANLPLELSADYTQVQDAIWRILEM